MATRRCLLIQFLALCAPLMMLPLSGNAQQPPATRLRGTIESIDGETLHIKLRDGQEIAAHMAADMKVSGVATISLSEVKAGSYIGTTTTPGTGDVQTAVEIHVFPENMRGTGEGSRPWDLKPNSSMTNGSVDPTVVGNDGHMLVVKFKGGEKKVMVTPDTAVVTYVPADKSDIKAGARIFAVATKSPEGTLDINRISVGRGGIAPPM